MRDERPTPVPDGVPRSPTGRVPQWVLDEAAGRAVSPVPFRGATATSTLRPPDRQRGGRTARLAGAVAVACALAAVGLHWQGVSSLPTARTSPSSELAAPPPAADGPRPSLDESPEPLGTPPAVPAMTEGEDYRFLEVDDDGRPVTWSPCRPLRYVTRPDHAPPGGGAMIAEAVAVVAAATGLRFEHAGSTAEAPSEQRPPYAPALHGERWAPVLIAWATAQEVPELAPEAVVGRGGPVRVRTSSGDDTYVSGSVALDPQGIARVVAEHGHTAGRAVVVHELGHLVGLDHVDSAAEVMAPEGTEVTELGRGDRAGLAALGRGPCQPDV